MIEERFITFTDIQGIEHTYRLVDIQAVGVGRDGKQSYIRAFNFPLTVPCEEAVHVRDVWMREG